MTATPSDPTSAGDERHSTSEGQTPVPPTSEDQLQQFWSRNRTVILAACVVALVTIIGFGVWDRMQKSKEVDVETAYAAATTPEALRSFAESHSGHSLAGAAYLRIADEASAAGKAADAVPNYEKAVAALKTGPLFARAKLGLAISQVTSGKTAEGTAGLKQLAEDAKEFRAVRAEAAYHLTSLAFDAGNAADVAKYSDLLGQIDQRNPWHDRAMMLRMKLPAAAQVAEPKKDAATGIQFAPGK